MSKQLDILKLILHQDEKSLANSKKAVFTFPSKEEIKEGKGRCFPNIPSFLYLLEKSSTSFTHWTPNVFNFGLYSSSGRLLGHREDNLAFINTFVVDVDSKKNTLDEIFSKTLSLNLPPTMILNTPKGYHLYYLLSSPIKKENLAQGKLGSIALREKLSLEIHGIDHGCNHFGIFRFPTKENILYFNKDYTYFFKEILSLLNSPSSSLEDRAKKDLENKNKDLYRQIDSGWFKILSNIKNPKSSLLGSGRNNLLFTLCLACYCSNLEKHRGRKAAFEFNSNLKNPLCSSEVEKTLNSAYSGRYKGASHYHVNRLLRAYSPAHAGNKALFWCKNKKTRLRRKHSYQHEWEEDFLTWLKENTHKNNPKIKTTTSQLSNTTKIPKSSLKILLANLNSRNKISLKTKKGRYGYTVILYLPYLFDKILNDKKIKSELYLKYKDDILKCLKIANVKSQTPVFFNFPQDFIYNKRRALKKSQDSG